MKTIFTLILFFAASFTYAQNYNIYISDAGNFNAPPWQILKFDQNGQNPVVFINSNISWPQDILFLEDSNTVLISNLNSGRITKYNSTTGAYIADFTNGIAGPTRMKIGADGYLYILQWNGNGKVLRYDLNGNFINEFTSVGVPQSIGIDWDINGNLYVSSYTGALVRKFDSNGVDMGVFINSNLLGPTNIWFDSNGDLLVSDYNGTSVKRFDASGNFLGNFLTGLSNSEGVGFFPNGNILIGNGATHAVKLFDSTGNYLQDIIPSGTANLITPNAVVVRPVTGVGLGEINSYNQVIFYPAVGSEFYISPACMYDIEKVFFYDITGKLCADFSIKQNAGILKVNEMAAGMYVVKIILKDKREFIQKLIIKR